MAFKAPSNFSEMVNGHFNKVFKRSKFIANPQSIIYILYSLSYCIYIYIYVYICVSLGVEYMHVILASQFSEYSNLHSSA